LRRIQGRFSRCVIQLALVEPRLGGRPGADRDLPGEVGEVGEGVPGAVQGVPAGGERECDLTFALDQRRLLTLPDAIGGRGDRAKGFPRVARADFGPGGIGRRGSLLGQRARADEESRIDVDLILGDGPVERDSAPVELVAAVLSELRPPGRVREDAGLHSTRDRLAHAIARHQPREPEE